jgi:hypothetical protein
MIRDWAEENLILAKWVKDVVFEMGCPCREAERLFAVPLADVLKAGYETFERPRFDSGTCCETYSLPQRRLIGSRITLDRTGTLPNIYGLPSMVSY